MIKIIRYSALIGLTFLVDLILYSAISDETFAASPDLIDKTLISNVTDSSFTVSWFSKDPGITEIVYGEGTPNQVAYDDRDADKPIFRYSHYATLKNLKENTVYKVKVNKETPEEIRQSTAYKNPYNPPSKINLSGNVISLTGFPGTDGAVYLLVGTNSQLLSAPLDPEGNWKFEYLPIMTRNYASYLILHLWDVIDLYAQTGIDGVAYTKTLHAQKKPVTMYLSQAKIPFYKMQLGNVDAYATSSAKPTLKQLNNPAATASAKPSSFFDVIWITMFDLFR